MDFLALALNYLISFFIGTPLDTLFTRFYTDDRLIQEGLHSHKNGFFYNLDIYDFIIVGGGSAGCVVANRLSAFNYRVLLLEAGGNPFPLSLVPSLALNLLRNPNHDWGYHTVPQKHAFMANTNNSFMVNRGKGLGGSSSLNLNMYMRGSPYDFDDWANVTGDDSWRYENLLPFFKRMENYHGHFHNNDLHSHDGPLYVESTKSFPMRDEWFEAAKEIGLMVKDPNGYQSESVFPVDLTTQRGTRSSTHRAYLYPVMGRSNLRVVTYAHVQKIIFDDKNNAIAVNYIHKNKTYQAVATREIILSAGAIATPQLLMLSGVGPKDHLNSLGIPVKVDLPVGQNLRDHIHAFVGPFIVDKGKSIMGGRDFDSASLQNYLQSGSGPYSTIRVGAGALLTSSLAANSDWPDIYGLQWAVGTSATFPVEMEHTFDLKPGVLQQYLANDVGNDSFYIVVALAKPKSFGELRLTSADPNEYPIIDPNYLSHPDDIKVLLEGVKRLVKMVETSEAFEKIGTRLTDSCFPGCEEFPNFSDEYWECYSRRFCASQWHHSGTCRMGRASGDPGAVVDSRLRVLGTTGLRVIDASIMPQVTTTNTNCPTIMIAEKGSQMILEDWGNHVDVPVVLHLIPHV